VERRRNSGIVSALGSLTHHRLPLPAQRSLVPDDPRVRILALIMAGGEGGRMGVLTAERAKPALPFGGAYRLIDFPLSHCHHGNITDVWVIEQFEPQSLNDHLVNGRPWDLDRTFGGLRIMPPFQAKKGTDGFAEGNADALFQNARFIRGFAPDVVLVLSADHVYHLDYRDVIAAHVARGAELTMVTTRVPMEDAKRFGNVQTDGDGHVTGFDYKPEQPKTDVATAEVFCYTATVLLETLDALSKRAKAEHGAEAGIGDYGETLVPELVKRGRCFSYPLDGYWRDLGVLESYWQAHQDLLGDAPRIDLDRADWPILSYGAGRPPAHLYATARVDDALVGPACEIRGDVARSVLSPGVRVQQRAAVHESVLLHGVSVAAGASVDRAIVDVDAVIEGGARIGERGAAITVIGRGAHIGKHARIRPGAQVRPGERVAEGAVVEAE
jgi:glucose-1-phosphate adenylyltransferase